MDKDKIFDRFERNIKEVTKTRRVPFLLMYYSDSAGEMSRDDIAILEETFDDFLRKKSKNGFLNLDLLIHTTGGDANTSYRLIQLIRSYCKNLTVLVATHAYSGGTLIAFGSNKVEMGRSATLSPIDIQVGSKQGEEEDERFPLLSIEKYLEFLDNCTKVYKIKEEPNRVQFLTELTNKLVNQVSPAGLGELFRLRSLTELHAKTLLHSYMFKDDSDKVQIADTIVSKFTKESPTHSFDMDINLVAETGLKAELMNPKVYILLKRIITDCVLLEKCGVICPFFPNSKNKRIPHFQIFDIGGSAI